MIKRIDDRLILVGIAHILPDSIREVQETIIEENPEVVGVELCPIRYSTLTAKGRKMWNPPAMGLRNSLLNLVLYFLQNRMARQTGTPVGEEMVAAIRSSEIVGARVELIDRDINITLQRFMDRIGVLERLRLMLEAFLAFFGFYGEIDLRNLTEEEIVKRLVSDLKMTSKTAYEVFIRERDDYMAERIDKLLKASSGKVVCAVGAGHVPNLCEKFKNYESL